MCEKVNVKLVLNWYEIIGKNLVDEEVIQGMSVDDILKLFDTPFWNNLYYCWAVETAHIKTLQKHVQHKINSKKYSYFVEIYKVN